MLDAEVGHAAADDDGADFAEELGLAAVGLLRRLPGEHPVVQALAAAAERILVRDVRAGGEAVEGHRDLHDHLAHRGFSFAEGQS